jgi:hypothetical protein
VLGFLATQRIKTPWKTMWTVTWQRAWSCYQEFAKLSVISRYSSRKRGLWNKIRKKKEQESWPPIWCNTAVQFDAILPPHLNGSRDSRSSAQRFKDYVLVSRWRERKTNVRKKDKTNAKSDVVFKGKVGQLRSYFDAKSCSMSASSSSSVSSFTRESLMKIQCSNSTSK